jgi:Tol biopolymer transport system component
MQQPVEGQGGAAIVLESARETWPTALAPDDRSLLFDFERDDGKFEMRRLMLGGGAGEPATVAAAEAMSLGGGVLSPDGRWIAFHLQSAGGWDVFVMPAAGGARKWQVTTDGAVYPRWAAGGRELWVSPFDGKLRVYAVDGSGDTFRIGSHRRGAEVPGPDITGSYYDLHPDGRRLLQTGTDPTFRGEVSLVHLVTDWRRGLVQ